MNKTSKYLSLLLVGLLTGCQADNLSTVNNRQIENKVSVANSINKDLKNSISSNDKLSAYGKISSTNAGSNSKNLKFSINYGAIRQGFKTQAIDCNSANADDITRLEVSVDGINMPTLYADGSDNTIAPNTVQANGCSVNNVSVLNVPYGKARVATVRAYTSTGELIQGATIRAVFDVNESPDEDVLINYNTTPTAEIIKSMITTTNTDPSNFLVSKIDLTALQQKIDAITVPVSANVFPYYTYTTHPTLINSSAIAADLTANGGNASTLVETKASYKITPVTITGTIAGLASDEEAFIRINDSASAVLTVSANGTFSIPNVNPNTDDYSQPWKISITPKNDATYSYTINAPSYNSFPSTTNTIGQPVDLGTVTLAANRTIYVNASATGDDTGNTWANAHTSLQTAMLAANSGDKIWVAKGTYKPTDATTITDTERNISFVIKSGVNIYGGFAGNEASNYDLTQRDLIINLTTLSGDIGTASDTSDNSTHVVTANNVSNATNAINNTITDTTSIDGFTISNGNANLSNDSNGGGMKNSSASNLNINNIIFSNNLATNFGGGIYSTSSTETLNKVSFLSNSATSSGGGMYSTSSTETLTNVIFSSNSTSTVTGSGGSIGGGGLYLNSSSSARLKNIVFYKNTSEKGGGLFLNSGTGVTHIVNSTFFDNITDDVTGGDGQAIYTLDNSPIILNSIFYSATNNNPQTILQSGTSVSIIGYSYLKDRFDSIKTETGGTTDIKSPLGVTLTTVNYTTLGFNRSRSDSGLVPSFIDTTDLDGANNKLMTSDDGLALSSNLSLNNNIRNGGINTDSVVEIPTTDIAGTTRTSAYSMGAYERN